MKLSGSEIIIEALKREGVDFIFGYPGGAVLHIYDALFKAKNIKFGKYSIHVGGNRGRGQVYPTGEKSNNNATTATDGGQIISIDAGEKGKQIINIQTTEGSTVNQTVPAGVELRVKVNDIVKKDDALTYDPNVGGFGQGETEIVLQNPNRVKGMIVFFFTVTVTQILLVLKKKQFEKVQAAEMNF